MKKFALPSHCNLDNALTHSTRPSPARGQKYYNLDISVWQVDDQAIQCLAVAPTQDWLATGSQAGVVKRWPLAVFLTNL